MTREADFADWLTERFGRWCIATRMTTRLLLKGYHKAIHPATYRKLWDEYQRGAS